MDFQEQLAQVAGNEPGTVDVEFAARSRRDPGTPQSALLALISVIVFYAMIVGGNLMPASTPAPDPDAEPPAWTEQDREDRLAETRMDPVAAITRMLMYADDVMQFPEDMMRQQIPPTDSDPMIRVQRVVMTGEFFGAEEALAELDRLEQLTVSEIELLDGALVVQELDVLDYLRQTYDGTLEPDALDASALDAKDYLGWWGTLARLHDAGESDKERSAMLEAGGRLFKFVLGMFGFAVVVVLAVIASAILMILRLTRGGFSSRLNPPLPGGSVYLEIFAVFLVGFLLVQLLGLLVGSTAGAEAGLWATLIGQWSLIAVPFWPLLRGVSLQRMRMDLGLHKGEGILREVGAGVVGYLAGLPLFIAAIVFMIAMQMVVQVASGSEEAVQPNNPMLDLVKQDNLPVILMAVSLAVFWAPLVEETVFRGALLRHVRSRVGFLIGALLTGVLFAFMHSYGPLFTPPLIALGFTFAMLREWRGSLIAPMVAHFLHNGTLMVVIITALSMLG